MHPYTVEAAGYEGNTAHRARDQDYRSLNKGTAVVQDSVPDVGDPVVRPESVGHRMVVALGHSW